jgi:antitoxin PrlF
LTPQEPADPVLDAFLDLLARDMEQHPERIKPLDEAMMRRAEELTEGMVVDPNEDLGDEDLLAQS